MMYKNKTIALVVNFFILNSCFADPLPFERQDRLNRPATPQMLSPDRASSLSDKEELKSELARAIVTRDRIAHALNRLQKLVQDKELKPAELREIVLYIETKLYPKKENIKSYLSREETGLARNLEYDKLNDRLYIHLELYGKAPRIGKGTKKIVTKSLLYDPYHPEIVAHCKTLRPLRQEIENVKALHNITGLLDVKSIMRRKNSEGSPVYSFMCHLYKKGTISKLMKAQKLALVQKMEISRDLFWGLHQLHSRGYVHRDMCGANCFVDQDAKTGKFFAVIADFGRTIEAAKAHKINSQGHKHFVPPEAHERKKLRAENYFKSDIYALGLTLYKFFYEKKAPWVDGKIFDDKSITKAERGAKLQALLKKYHQDEVYKLQKELHHDLEKEVERRCKLLIMQMVHPDMSKRGSAKYYYAKMLSILQDFSNQDKRDINKR